MICYLFNQTIKLEEMEKKAGNAEGQVGVLARRLMLMEEQSTRSEERLAISVTKLANTSISQTRAWQTRTMMNLKIS